MSLPATRLAFWLCAERLRREFEDAFDADQHEKAAYIAQDIRLIEDATPTTKEVGE